MADVPGIGAFIPNKDGYPKILTMNPAERAQYLASKEAEKTPAQQETQQAVEPVSTAENGGGIDVQV
jgi:hypothetical protein